jgi:hypothetical protein
LSSKQHDLALRTRSGRRAADLVRTADNPHGSLVREVTVAALLL